MTQLSALEEIRALLVQGGWVMLPIFLLGLFAWILIFYLRAITEERHLLKDSEYQKYTEEVKYRFIPNLF